jgi:hypothetical protein
MYFEFTERHFWITLILIAALFGAVQGTCAYLILAERKISAWAQDRLGPNRVGPFGLLQPIADGIKFLLKEQVVPSHVDKLFYFLGPAIAVSTALLAIAVVPFGPTTVPPTLLDRRTEEMVAASKKPLSEKGRELLQKAADGKDPENFFSVSVRGPVWPRTETEKAVVLAADAAWAKTNDEKTFPERL